MSANGFPWNVLGIEPTDDASEIRRVYAAKLKMTRPDEDPAGFQLLLEARNLALQVKGAEFRGAVVFESGLDLALELDVSAPANVSPQSDDVPEILRLLSEIPRKTYPDQVEEPWRNVIAALDHAPLDQLPRLRYALIHHLVSAMAEDLGPMPNLEFLPKSAWKNPGLLGPYVKVLRDFEQRFSLLEQDKRLFELLDWERGWYFLTAIEIAVGGRRLSRTKVTPFREVRAADFIWAATAFGKDPKMLEYQMVAVAMDKYPQSPSIVGLLFPLPVALYYRLYGFAASLAAIAVSIAVGRIGWKLGGSEYYLLAAVLPAFSAPFLAYLAAFSIRGMRLTALGRKVASLAKSEDLPTITRKVEEWSKPNTTGMIAGIALIAITILSFVLI